MLKNHRMSEENSLPAKVTPEHTRGAEAVLGRQQSSLLTSPAQLQPFPVPAEPDTGPTALGKRADDCPQEQIPKKNR